MRSLAPGSSPGANRHRQGLGRLAARDGKGTLDGDIIADYSVDSVDLMEGIT